MVINSKKFYICEKNAVECASTSEGNSKANDFKILIACTADNNKGSYVTVQYSFRCNRIPIWCTFWTIKLYLQRVIPMFLSTAEQACENYKDFLMKEENPISSINTNYK
ncbi:hypothetical protein HELRODRAFT_167787 [Helobdella robusta]|uniref:START domain-containing protein n=1 Tax=Helobdella robusta TaxID=6412 RepID=T1EZT2_HELRO|nr:hypothetical protein HELRODRAFT_167787 [Helobdella robusta]ESO09957.1 hypothetical protein HELRODRAFT_167787 [Helobdella robusta]